MLNSSPTSDLLRLAADDGRHYTVWPPSTTIAAPVTKEAASEHSHRTTAAISSGLPTLTIGSCAMARDLPLPPLGGALAEAIHHRRVDDPGAHGVDADVLWGVVEGRRCRPRRVSRRCTRLRLRSP